MTHRCFFTTSVQLLGRTLIFDSVVDPWGEDDPILAQIVAGRFDEPRSLHFWCFLANTCAANSLFLDVGAFTGLYALSAVRMGNAVKAVAIEPASATFGRLLRNICLNDMDGNILPANVAAGNVDGNKLMTHQYGIYTLCPGESIRTDSGDHTEYVYSTRLDRLLETEASPFIDSKAFGISPIERIAAIKIDVEGAEPEVLKGATRLIEAFRPAIIAEFLSTKALNSLLEIAEPAGYQPVLPENERNVFLLPEAGFDKIENDYREWSAAHGSDLALRSERLAEMRFERPYGTSAIRLVCDRGRPGMEASVTERNMHLAIPQSFRSIPARLKICEAAPSASEMALADSVREEFRRPNETKPYMNDVVRAFRTLREARIYLEIGTFDRGNLAYASALLAGDAILIGVDIVSDEERDEQLRQKLKKGQRYISIVGDSQATPTIESVKRALGSQRLHAVFIDGNHTAPVVTSDYAHFGALAENGGIIMLRNCLWEGNAVNKGAADAIAEIDRLDPVYLIPGEGPCYRFMRSPWRTEVWGVIGVHIKSGSSSPF